jgi:sulfide:quinone oxidoreductase
MFSDGTEVEYEFLVVSTGTQPGFDNIEGLPDAFNSPGVCSIYDYKLAQKTRDELQKFSGGTAVFTHPLSSINCAGANQKIMYLADDIFRENSVRDSSGIIYNTAMEKIFDIDRYKESLDKIMDDKHIVVHTRQNLKKVDASSKIAYFDVLDKDGKSTGETKQVQYEFLHVG